MVSIELTVGAYQCLTVTTIDAFLVIVVLTVVRFFGTNGCRGLRPHAEQSKVFRESGDVSVLDSILHLARGAPDVVFRRTGEIEERGEATGSGPTTTGIVDVEDHGRVIFVVQIQIQQTLKTF